MKTNLIETIENAEKFISAFEGEETKEGVDKLLEELRTVIAAVEPSSAPVILRTRPMSCAPKNQVILTNEGLVRYVDPKNWGSPVTRGWYNCTLDGDIASCADDGMAISHAEPQFWTEVPLLATPEASAALAAPEGESTL